LAHSVYSAQNKKISNRDMSVQKEE